MDGPAAYLWALGISNHRGGVTMRYYAVSDESQITAARYRSIAAISLPVEEAGAFNERVSRIICTSNVRELKWKELRGAKEGFCATKVIDAVLDHLLARNGRVDVLVWDTHDSRHAVPNRHDDKNFERMYFHLHRTLMGRREPDAHWHLRPDERLGIDWETLQECLGHVGAWRKYYERTLLSEEYSVAQFHVRSLKQVRSSDLALCQVADLFAGMAAYTRTKSALLRQQLERATRQQSLFSEGDDHILSSSDRARVPVILHFNDRCKAAKLGVSLKTNAYLLTPNPANPINFWHYAPQHGSDRAPTRDA